MSRMKDLIIDIQDAIEAGELTFEQIAQAYDVEVDQVQDLARGLYEYYDHQSSLYQDLDVGCEFDPKVQ